MLEESCKVPSNAIIELQKCLDSETFRSQKNENDNTETTQINQEQNTYRLIDVVNKINLKLFQMSKDLGVQFGTTMSLIIFQDEKYFILTIEP